MIVTQKIRRSVQMRALIARSAFVSLLVLGVEPLFVAEKAANKTLTAGQMAQVVASVFNLNVSIIVHVDKLVVWMGTAKDSKEAVLTAETVLVFLW